jgi:1-aminocyclopropane-1-carboxylate deaminase/D-cysteine desulfhydrase-like pyridoxal-dependent ACC family enzyme
MPESAVTTVEDLRARIAKVPRVRLAFLPTPLQHCPHLSADLGVQLWVKRDDLTGLALGGNKTRNLEFRMAEAVEAGADILVFGVEITSNSARQTAAAANALGLPLVLVLRGEPEGEPQGNLLVNLLLGAEVRLTDVPSFNHLGPVLERVAAELTSQGRHPFILNHAAMFARASALGYIESLLEILDQLGRPPDWLFICSGGKAQAGLVLARKVLGLPTRVVGVAATRNEDPWEWTARVANETAELLGLDVRIEPGEVENGFDYIGEGYGIPTEGGLDAIVRFARREGILLDPVYSGKAAAGCLDRIGRGDVAPGATVVFIHTGGQPALFSQGRALVEHLRRQPGAGKIGRV